MAVPHLDKNNKKNELVDGKMKRLDQRQKQKQQKQYNERSHTSSHVVSDSSNCGYSSSESSWSSSSTPTTQQRYRQNKNRKKSNERPNSKVFPKLATKKMTQEEKNRYVAMDCEMVGVGMDGISSALARVTIIDWYGNILLDEYIKPDREVTDYRTFVSGITEQHLMQETTLDIQSCRSMVSEKIKDKILIGHALKNDLHALGISHPWHQTRDTAKYKPFMKIRYDDGILWPRKLKELAHERLHREVQTEGKCHSPYEDALTALDLYKSVRAKWENIMEYKIKKTREIEQEKQQQKYLQTIQWPTLKKQPET